MKRLWKILLIVFVFYGTSFGQNTQQDDEVIVRDGHFNTNRKQKKIIRQEYMHEVGITNYARRKSDARRNGLTIGVYSATHFLFGFWTEYAYSQPFFISTNFLNASVGDSFGGGFCFDFQRFYFRAQLGLGYRVQNLSALVNDVSIIDNNVSDSWGYKYYLKYDFTNRKDYGQQHTLQIPLLVGSGIGQFYAMGGAKFQVNMHTKAFSDAICTTTATYDQYSGVFEEMDNHGLRKNVDISCSSEVKPWTVFDLYASLELGWEYSGGVRTPGTTRYVSIGKLNNAPEWRIRLALFCDINFMHHVKGYSKINNNNEVLRDLVEIPPDSKWDFSTFSMKNVLYSDKKIAGYSDINVGLKLTICLGFYINSRCIQCTPSDNLLYRLHGRPSKL